MEEPKIDPKLVIKIKPRMVRECVGCEAVAFIPIVIIILILIHIL